MKKLILLSAIALSMLNSCKKDDDDNDSSRLKYEVICGSCKVTYSDESGSDKTVNVVEFWSTSINNYNQVNAKMTVESPDYTISNIYWNDNRILNKIGAGNFEVKVK